LVPVIVSHLGDPNAITEDLHVLDGVMQYSRPQQLQCSERNLFVAGVFRGFGNTMHHNKKQHHINVICAVLNVRTLNSIVWYLVFAPKYLTFLKADGFFALGTSRSLPRFFTGADMRDLTRSTPALFCKRATHTEASKFIIKIL